MNKTIPKGISLLTEENSKRRYVQIDIATLAKEPDAVEDYLDGLIAEARRSEPTISHDEVLRTMAKRGKRK